MENDTREPTPEQLEQREEWKEREQLEKAQQTSKPAPQRQLDNSRFLARPWINLPEVNEAPAKDRVRVMTWNVCPTVSGCYQPKLNIGFSC